jgi:NADH-quinone oxidoreductase subunit A
VNRSEGQILKPRPQWTDEDRQQVRTSADQLATAKFAEMGVSQPTMDRILDKPTGDVRENLASINQTAGNLARMSLWDIGVFFAVLMVGFFYVWRRGDLDWVRAVSRERSGQLDRGPSLAIVDEAPALSA